MSIINICCNKELVTSCVYGYDNRYCINTDETTYIYPLDGSCSEYINRDALRNILKVLEENR